MVILDTDHMTFLEREQGLTAVRLRNRLSQLKVGEAATTIVSFEEQMRGWLGFIAQASTLARQIEGYRRMKRHLSLYCSILVLDFDELAAVYYQSLKKNKIRVKPMDMKIASIALSRDATVLSRNTVDFQKIPGLRFEDWTNE